MLLIPIVGSVMFERVLEYDVRTEHGSTVRMTASQWFGRYGWVALLSLLVPGLACAVWLHFVNRDTKKSEVWVWCWSAVASAAALCVVAYLIDENGAQFFAEGAGFLDQVAGLYICGAIATALVVVLTVMFALSPVFEVIGAILRIFG